MVLGGEASGSTTPRAVARTRLAGCTSSAAAALSSPCASSSARQVRIRQVCVRQVCARQAAEIVEVAGRLQLIGRGSSRHLIGVVQLAQRGQLHADHNHGHG